MELRSDEYATLATRAADRGLDGDDLEPDLRARNILYGQVQATLAVAAATERLAEMLARIVDDGLKVNQKDYRI